MYEVCEMNYPVICYGNAGYPFYCFSEEYFFQGYELAIKFNGQTDQYVCIYQGQVELMQSPAGNPFTLKLPAGGM